MARGLPPERTRDVTWNVQYLSLNMTEDASRERSHARCVRNAGNLSLDA
jgi:hypothetical protein